MLRDSVDDTLANYSSDIMEINENMGEMESVDDSDLNGASQDDGILGASAGTFTDLQNIVDKAKKRFYGGID